MSTLSHMGEQYGKTVRELAKIVGEDEAMELVRMTLLRPTIVTEGGRELTGPEMLRRMAQEKWSGVFSDDLQYRMHEAGDARFLN
jgi:hypothetical protein